MSEQPIQFSLHAEALAMAASDLGMGKVLLEADSMALKAKSGSGDP